MRWDKKDIPHKGWIEIGMEDLGEKLNLEMKYSMNSVKCVGMKKYAMFIL